MRLVNMDALQDYHHLETLYEPTRDRGNLEANGDDGADRDDLPSLAVALAERARTEDAAALAAQLAADDELESTIRRREKKYFDVMGTARMSLARKVALATEMNPLFVADARLWRWMDEVMEHYGISYNDSGPTEFD